MMERPITPGAPKPEQVADLFATIRAAQGRTLEPARLPWPIRLRQFVARVWGRAGVLLKK